MNRLELDLLFNLDFMLKVKLETFGKLEKYATASPSWCAKVTPVKLSKDVADQVICAYGFVEHRTRLLIFFRSDICTFGLCLSGSRVFDW
jgi:hypothetical protein